MPRPLSDHVPPTMRKRMETLKIKTVRQLAERMNRSETAVGAYLKSSKPSLLVLVDLLKGLGYSCSSPEFDLINELLDVKDLSKHKQPCRLSKSEQIQQYSFRQSRWPKAA